VQFHTFTKIDDVAILPPSQGFNFMRCETWEDASICCIAVRNWLTMGMKEGEHYGKAIGSRQAQEFFVEVLRELQEETERWLIESEEEVV
jgi:hypothetical protein